MNIKIIKKEEIPRYDINDLFGEMKVKFVDYSDGFLLVKTKRFWFLDIKNNKLFGPFKEANMFNNDLARVVDLEDNLKYMKKDGSFIKSKVINGVSRNYCSNKLVSKNEREFYIYDNKGRLINKIEAKNVNDFSGPYAASLLEDEKGLYYKYLDSFGNLTNMRRYERLYDFNEYLAIGKPFQDYKSENSTIYHIFDEDLDIIGKFKAASIIGGKFVNGLCIITNWDRDGFLKFGYANEYGEYQIPCMYDMAYNFSDGLAKVKLNAKYGYIDENNNMVLHNMFDEASDFINGLAVVKYNGLWYIINKLGEFVLSTYTEKPTIIEDMIFFDDNTYLPIKDLDKKYKVQIVSSENKIECSFDSSEKRDKFYDEQIYKLNKSMADIKKFEDDSSKELFSQIERTIKTKKLINK